MTKSSRFDSLCCDIFACCCHHDNSEKQREFRGTRFEPHKAQIHEPTREHLTKCRRREKKERLPSPPFGEMGGVPERTKVDHIGLVLFLLIHFFRRSSRKKGCYGKVRRP